MSSPSSDRRSRPAVIRQAAKAVLSTQPDGRLVALAREGSAGAFEEIVRRYRSALLRYSRGIVEEGAEDAVQHAFLNAHRALRRGDDLVDLRPWLYRLTHNAAVDVRRRQGPETSPLNPQVDGVEQPHDALMKREALGELVTQMGRLPRRQREALVMRELEGRGHDEIAELLGVSGGAVRQLIHRARRTLRSAAAFLVPPGLVERVAGAGAADRPARVAEIVTGGAGLGAVMAKGGAAVLATSAVVIGGIQVSSIPSGDRATAGAPTSRSAGESAIRSRESASDHRAAPLAADDDLTRPERRNRENTETSERARTAAPVARHVRPASERDGDDLAGPPERTSETELDAPEAERVQPDSGLDGVQEQRVEEPEPEVSEAPESHAVLAADDDSATSDDASDSDLAEAATTESSDELEDDAPTD